VAMEQQTRDGKPRLVERCALPPTARGVVNFVVTNYGLFEITKQGMALREIAPGVTVEEVKATTGCNLIVPAEVPPVRMVGREHGRMVGATREPHRRPERPWVSLRSTHPTSQGEAGRSPWQRQPELVRQPESGPPLRAQRGKGPCHCSP